MCFCVIPSAVTHRESISENNALFDSLETCECWCDIEILTSGRGTVFASEYCPLKKFTEGGQ